MITDNDSSNNIFKIMLLQIIQVYKNITNGGYWRGKKRMKVTGLD